MNIPKTTLTLTTLAAVTALTPVTFPAGATETANPAIKCLGKPLTAAQAAKTLDVPISKIRTSSCAAQSIHGKSGFSLFNTRTYSSGKRNITAGTLAVNFGENLLKTMPEGKKIIRKSDTVTYQPATGGWVTIRKTGAGNNIVWVVGTSPKSSREAFTAARLQASKL